MTNPIYLSGENCSSFELRKMSKGYAWTIKIYNPDLEQGYQIVKKLNKQAAKDYGINDNSTEES